MGANDLDTHFITDLTTRMKHVLSHSSSDLDTNVGAHKNHLMNANELGCDSDVDPTTHLKPVMIHSRSKLEFYVPKKPIFWS